MKMKLKNLKQGRTIYLVTAIGKDSMVEKAMIKSKDIDPVDECIDTTMFIDISTGDPVGDFFSPGDYNIGVRNGYNNHKAFFSLRKAKSYLNIAVQEVIPELAYEWTPDYNY